MSSQPYKTVNLSPEQKIAALRKETARIYREDLYALCKHGLGYSEMNWRTHGGMIEALESPTLKKLIVMPRGTFKSSIGVVGYAIWRLIRDPNERILIDSEIYTNSKNFLREIKAHLQNPRMVELFGSFVGPNWTEGELTIAQRTKPYKEASITCGGIETTKVGQHYSAIIHDDVNSGNNSQTEEGRQKVITHYRMNTAILDPGGTTVVIGTRYAQNDLIGHILENEVTQKRYQGTQAEQDSIYDQVLFGSGGPSQDRGVEPSH